MQPSALRQLQAYGLLLALVVGGLGYPLAHAVEHHAHTVAHGEGIHGHVHTDDVAFSVGVPEAAYHSLDCAYCLTMSSALVASETGTAPSLFQPSAEDARTVRSVGMVYRSDAPRGPPDQA